MGGTGVIDQFLETFTRYIDTGFGLVGGEVGYLATTLAAIDITLAGLFWAWGPDEDIIARLVKKTLFVGVFAFLISNWNSLARIVFESFAGLGLKASGTGLSSADFLRPGRIAQVGLDAGRPILESISGLMGYVSFFENFVQIVVLLFAWIVVLLTFFILAILTVAGTAAAMGMRNAVHCVLALTLGFAGVAAIYLQLDAQFVGLTQIMVYVGAVAILAVFAIMMTHSPTSVKIAAYSP